MCIKIIVFVNCVSFSVLLFEETLKYKETNFSFVEEFIQPAKFLADLSRSNNNDNSTLQKITDDFLKMINHTNSSRHFEPSVSVVISQDTESLPISNFNDESKHFVRCTVVKSNGQRLWIKFFLIRLGSCVPGGDYLESACSYLRKY